MTAHEQHQPDLTAAPARHGQYWEITDYTLLVDGLRHGRPLDDLATDLGRTPGAVSGRLSLLVPDAADVPRRAFDRELWLREVLHTEPDYDWFRIVREHHTARGLHLWTETEDEQLRSAWHGRTELAVLAVHLGIPELQIVRRCVQLTLAANLPDVAEHLAAAPGSAVDIRARLALDRAAAAVWVLVVDGAGQRVNTLERHRRHISTHASFDAAMDAAGSLLASADDEADVRYSIAERTVGENTIGATHHALHGPQDTTAEPITE